MTEILSELAAGGFLAEKANLIQGISVHAANTSCFRTFTAGTVLVTFLTLSTNISVANRALSDALVAEEVASSADADTIFGVGASGAGSDTGGSNKVESFNAGGAAGRSTRAGIARIGAVITDSIDWYGLRVGAGGTECKARASFAFLTASNTDVAGSINKHIRIAGFDTSSTKFIVSNSTVNTVRACVDTTFTFRIARFTFTIN